MQVKVAGQTPAVRHGEVLVASRLRFHDLRRTAASPFIAHGGQPKQVREALGHADINTTYKRYGHLFDGHDAALLDALDAAHEQTGNIVALRRDEAA